MRNLALVAAVAVALAVPAGVAYAAENHPDCEPGQPDKTETAGNPNICEGEHWDGQDPTGVPGSGLGAGLGGGGAYAQVGGSGNGDSTGNPGPKPPQGVGSLDLHHFRVAVHPGTQQVYYYQAQWGVGSQAVWTNGKSLSWYGRDNTNQVQVGTIGVCAVVLGAINTDPDEGNAGGNCVAWVVGALYDVPFIPKIGGFRTGESDCNHASYDPGAGYDCYRDNTAVTVVLA